MSELITISEFLEMISTLIRTSTEKSTETQNIHLIRIIIGHLF